MIFMSVYYCMLLTNWNIVSADASNPIILTQSWVSFWVKIIALLATVLLYIWMMVAPKLFPDREFEF